MEEQSSSITAGHLRRLFPKSSYSSALLNDRRAGHSGGGSSKGPSGSTEDPLAYRSEGGESYLDVIERTRPIVIGQPDLKSISSLSIAC
jgi:hypothetical protein